MSGPREEDGDYAREFFGGYERAADEAATRSFVTAIRKQTKAERERDEARAERDRARSVAVTLEQEEGEARAALARVAALADFWEGTCDPSFPPSNVMDAMFAVDQIRAVLAGGHAGPGGVRFDGTTT